MAETEENYIPLNGKTNTEGGESKKRKNPFRLQKEKEDRERRQKKKARLIIRNISYKANEEELRKHFSQWGELEDVNLLKRPDGKLVGCAFVQYATINQATKAILKGNNSEICGRPVFVDWALGKNEYQKQKEQSEPQEKKPKLEDVKDEVKEESIDADESAVKEENDDEEEENEEQKDSEENDSATYDAEEDDEDENEEDDSEEGEDDDSDDPDDDNKDKKDLKNKLKIDKLNKEKHISNDVQQGCTVFIKNVPFDAEDDDLRKVCRKFGPLWYAIINREPISGHSKGTAFVKFKAKESADLCLQAGTEFKLMDEVLDPHPALSKDEIHQKKNEKLKSETEGKDSRNLYLAREGLIMANSSAAEGVSASDMNKRHKLEQIKAQVLKNLNRFVSRNRLSIHNLPLNYDNDKLKQLAITYTGFKPHECRVMRENRITPEHPQGKSKGFGFVSFNTHKEALTALRKLNNNPNVFGPQHRPIVAFSIEDRAVHKIKEKRAEKSKVNNPTYQQKLEKRKELRKAKQNGGKNKKSPIGPQSDNKQKLKKHIKALEESRVAKQRPHNKKSEAVEAPYVGTEAKPGTNLSLRSNKKIKEQSQEHLKRVKANKRKVKQQKIRQEHLAERKAVVRPKQGHKVERDDLKHLVSKYKRMIDSKANEGSVLNGVVSGSMEKKTKKPKRSKWYTE